MSGAPARTSGRRLDVALLLLLALTCGTWLTFDGALNLGSVTVVVLGITTAKALIVMTTFMELRRGPRWAFVGLVVLFATIAAALASLLG